MREWIRLLGYARRYWFLLIISVLLMAIFGAMTAARVLLIKVVLGRVLRPGLDAMPEPLFKIPVINYQIYLENFFPQSIHNIFTIVAITIVVVFALRGICDYLGDYLTNFVGFSAVTDLRNQVFEKVLRHGAAFFEATSTGRLMSSIMNDIDKIQVASSDMFADHAAADLLRVRLAAGHFRNRLAAGAFQPRAVSVRSVADRAAGQTYPPHEPQNAGRGGRPESGLAGSHRRTSGGKGVRGGEV